MMPRAAAELFAHITRDASHLYTVTMSYVQIYMELLQARDHLTDYPRHYAICAP